VTRGHRPRPAHVQGLTSAALTETTFRRVVPLCTGIRHHVGTWRVRSDDPARRAARHHHAPPPTAARAVLRRAWGAGTTRCQKVPGIALRSRVSDRRATMSAFARRSNRRRRRHALKYALREMVDAGCGDSDRGASHRPPCGARVTRLAAELNGKRWDGRRATTMRQRGCLIMLTPWP
jgi:hypothetical protein